MWNAHRTRLMTLVFVCLAGAPGLLFAQTEAPKLRLAPPAPVKIIWRQVPKCLFAIRLDARACTSVAQSRSQVPSPEPPADPDLVNFFWGILGPIINGDVDHPPSGPDTAVSSNRTSTAFPTGFTGPGTTIYRQVGGSLNEGDLAAMKGILDEEVTISAKTELVREVGVSATRNLPSEFINRNHGRFDGSSVPRRRKLASLAMYGDASWTTLPDPKSATRDDMNAGADAVLVGIRDGLLRGNPTSFATLQKTTGGGYHGGLKFGGGLKVGLRGSLAGFRPSLRGGVAFVVPLGSPRVHNFVLDYGFTAGSVNFGQVDNATFTITRGKAFGFQGGASLRRDVGPLDLVIDVLVEALQNKFDVTLSTNPSTTSSLPGAVVFSTPPGTRTILISTFPGLPSSLSTAVTNHRLVTSRGWSVGPVLRFGVVF